MQAVEPDVERHLDAAHDHGLDAVEGYLETGNGVGIHVVYRRRATSLVLLAATISIWQKRSGN
jgi:hypothetical protein